MARRDFGAKSTFKEKGRVEEPTWEDPLAKDKGKGAVGKGRVEEQERDKERKLSEVQAPGEKQGWGQGKGRGVERLHDQDGEKAEAGILTRHQRWDRARRKGHCKEKWGIGARGGGGARCSCKCRCRCETRTGLNRWGAANARKGNRDRVKSGGGNERSG